MPFYSLLLLLALSILLYIGVAFLIHFNARKKPSSPYQLKRSSNNPLLSPVGHSPWESCATFNPAAYKDDDGIVHLMYRAIGDDGQSRIGYASSTDGHSFVRPLLFPVFTMSSPRGPACRAYDPVQYPSGGSWGGCEDPRLVKIDDRLYLTFNAFDGWDYIRIGLTSIAEKDFLAQKWKWDDPILISPVGEMHKSWMLFPQKFHDKYAILHSITPHVQIDYVDDLDALGYGREKIKSTFSARERKDKWDSFLRGPGAPPIKTDKGWLVLYHAVQKHEPDRYKVGALLLDLDDPRRVIARSQGPILSPDEWYENDGKPGIVYVCGAVIKDDSLYVYYGAGDTHVCVAETKLAELFNWLDWEK